MHVRICACKPVSMYEFVYMCVCVCVFIHCVCMCVGVCPYYKH